MGGGLGTAVGTAFQAVGSYRQGRAEKAAAEQNAIIAKYEAEKQAQSLLESGVQQAAGARQAVYRSGFEVTGSAANYVNAIMQTARKEAFDVRAGGQRTAGQLRQQGKDAFRAGLIGAGGAIITGATRLHSQRQRKKQFEKVLEKK